MFYYKESHKGSESDENPMDKVQESLTQNEVLRLLGAVQGYNNANFLMQGLQRLMRNYVRPFKAKLPGPSYYRIPFHKELTLLLFIIVTNNSSLIDQVITKTQKPIWEKEQFAAVLGKFLVVRLHELKKPRNTFEKNMLMVISYTLFSLSGTQPELMRALSTMEVDKKLKVAGAAGTYLDTIISMLCKMIIQGNEETLKGIAMNEVNTIYDILTGTFFNMYRSIAITHISKEASLKLIELADHLGGNCFSQNPQKKSNSLAHLRIIYLRSLLNLFKGFTRLSQNIIEKGKSADFKEEDSEFLQLISTKGRANLMSLQLKFEVTEANNQMELKPTLQQQNEIEEEVKQDIRSAVKLVNQHEEDIQEVQHTRPKQKDMNSYFLTLQMNVLFEMKGVIKTLWQMIQRIGELTESHLGDSQPNIQGIDSIQTTRQKVQQTYHLTTGLLKQILPGVSIETEGLAINKPLLFTFSTQFESWLSSVIWGRVVVNHFDELFDKESVGTFPMFSPNIERRVGEDLQSLAMQLITDMS